MTLQQVEDRLITGDMKYLVSEFPEGSEARKNAELSIHYAKLVAATLHQVMQDTDKLDND